jgi:RHS repeat-associated protein
VRSVVSDIKAPIAHGDPAQGFNPIVRSQNDYYPFGMQMPGRIYNSSSYRYGFNGQERDDEVKGSGNSYDFGARMYDPRIGRFFSTDRYESKFAFKSPYSYADNSPIANVDANGDSSVVVVSGVGREVKSEQTGRISIMYDVQVYENMTAAQYQQHKTDGTLPEPSYTTQLARDAHDIKSRGEIVNHSDKRYGTNNETPPGTYFLFKKGTNGDYSTGAYELYLGDKNGSRVINGPDGIREGIAIHQYDPNDSQGCLTTCSGRETEPVTNIMDAIPDLNDDSQPVEIILEERSATKGTFSNPANGTKYTGTTDDQNP